MSDIALIDAGTSWPPPGQGASPLPEGVDVVDVYDLPCADLRSYRAVIVTGSADQRHLARHRQLFADVLDRRGAVAFSGHLVSGWLPGSGPFRPIEPRGVGDYRVRPVGGHPVFAGVDADDLTFRRGVAGFFARGSHPVPAGAEVIAELAGGQPTTYTDTVSSRGTLLVHAGQDLLSYGDSETTAARVAGQLLAWLRTVGVRR